MHSSPLALLALVHLHLSVAIRLHPLLIVGSQVMGQQNTSLTERNLFLYVLTGVCWEDLEGVVRYWGSQPYAMQADRMLNAECFRGFQPYGRYECPY